ncbi:MAG: hypothetical protein JKY56_07280 [Kofleriaceae bacterium]|nr:hypothetical protein [Kofleriaceae bacterium]
MWAHSGAGAWLDMGTQFCHVDAGLSVRIRGLRPFERRKLATANLEIELDTENLVVHLDGQIVQNLSVIAPGQFVLSDVGLGDSGWHKLELFDDDKLARALRYFIIDTPQVSWQADLAPVFAASCAGELCHGPTPKGSRIDLSTYESWKTRAGLIRRRLLLGEMPIGDSLPHETIKRVSRWVEGGMLP